MLRIVGVFLYVIVCDLLPLLAKANYTPVVSAPSYFSTQAEHIPTKIDRQAGENSELAAIPAFYKSVSSTNNSQIEYIEINSDYNKLDDKNKYFIENKGTNSLFYYNAPMKTKGFLTQLFIGGHFSAKMKTFKNSDIPFLARGSGVTTEVSTQSTHLSASYFKLNSQKVGQNSTKIGHQKKKQPLASDTKLALAIPFFPQLKLFGGYSYNRSSESRLTKGPSFGFQADIFDHIKVDTTFVKQTVGKTSAKVLFSLSMPLERIKF
ncbi:MAG: hypothetical protein V4544_05240 [Pseudomonadota bacterium]